MNRRLLISLVLLVAGGLLLAAALSGCRKQTVYRHSRIAMGTTVEVISPDPRAAGIAFEEIERIENLLSIYKEDSEIARLNRYGQLPVSRETLFVLKQAQKFYRLSGGSFDVTVASLIDIWRPGDKQNELPADDKIEQALKLVGFDKVIIDEAAGLVRFAYPGMKIDLGGIAKGYAVDSAIQKIKQAGIGSCLINAGGDIYCLGDKFGSPWQVAIKNPRGGGFAGNLRLKDKAVATSGDYEQYFMREGRRYSHILDPRTGYPADRGIISVTVVAPDCLTSDALATSIFVLGKEKGVKLAENFQGVQVDIIEEKDVPDYQ